MSTVSITYAITSSVLSSDSKTVNIGYTLSNSDTGLTANYTVALPVALLGQNVLDTMNSGQKHTQIDGNFRALTQNTFDAFKQAVLAQSAAPAIMANLGSGNVVALSQMVSDIGGEAEL